MQITHESIFVSAIRSFCKAFFSIIGLGLAIFISALIVSLFLSPYEVEEKTTLNILPNLNDDTQLVSLSSPAILRINITGVIGEPNVLDTQTIENILVDAQQGFLKNNRVKAILLNFNTPGGTVTDSDNIYRMLKTYKEKHEIPIYAYINGLCASGGMYISSAADRSFASPSSIVGSVGVIFGPFFNVVDAMGKIGVQAKTLTQGIDKDMMSPFRQWKPDEDAPFQTVMSFFYHRFVDIVTAARPRLDKTKLVNEYGAKIFDGPQAVELGYIDVANADYNTALQALLEAAKIDPKSPYQIVELVPKHTWLSPLVNSAASLFTGKIEHVISFGDKRSSVIRDQFAYLFDPAAK